MSQVAGERIRSLTDFEGSDYLRHPLPHSERTKHLESWLREALILPFEYQAVINQQGEFVSFGQRMVEINEHAIEARKGQVGEARVVAEMEGMVRVEALLNKAEVGDTLFLFSPPGSVEEGFGIDDQRRLSFTYIFEISEGEGSDRRSVRVIVVPVLEIPPLVQVKQFMSVFVDTDASALLSLSDAPIDRKLVSTPILISGLDAKTRKEKLNTYLKIYNGKDFDELQQSIEDGLKLDKDMHAEKRRKSLIQTISWQIRRYVDAKDGARLNNIGEAARVVMAREASGHYLDMTPEEMLDEYSKTESAMWMQLQYQLADRKEKDQLYAKYGAQLIVSEMHLRSVREALQNDPKATSMLMGSACGGGGLGEVISGMGSKFGQELMGRGHLLEKQMESLKTNTSSGSGSDEMKCVTCPFCSSLVDAIVTSEKIECPKCHKSASRG